MSTRPVALGGTTSPTITLQVATAFTVWRLTATDAVRSRLSGERGEGVVSMAVAILIIAALGGIAFAVFRGLLQNAADKGNQQIDRIGTP